MAATPTTLKMLTGVTVLLGAAWGLAGAVHPLRPGGADDPDAVPVHVSKWQDMIEAGVHFVDQQDYRAAERSLLAAVEAARMAPVERGRLALSCNQLGTLYFLLGRYGEAETFFKQAMLSWKKEFPPDQPGLLRIVNNLTQVYLSRGQFGKAERLCRVAAALPPQERIDSARRLANLAALFTELRKFGDAESAYRQAEAIWQQELGPEHAEIATIVNNLGIICAKTGRRAEALSHFERALAIWKRAGADQEGLPTLLANLGNLYVSAGRISEAEQAFLEALRASERCAAVADRTKLEIFSGYATLLHRLKRRREAKDMEARAQSVLRKLASEDLSRYSVDVSDFRKIAGSSR